MGVIHSVDHQAPLGRLRFLVGTWRGVGVVTDGNVTASVVASDGGDGTIELVHETRGEGLPVHRERIVLREHRGRTTARIRADGGAEQEFRLVESPAGVLRFVHLTGKREEIAWEVEPAGADAWTERFFVPGDGAPRKAVELRHVRVTA